MTRTELLLAIIEADAKGASEQAAALRKQLVKLDVEAVTTHEVDYERGRTHKTVRTYRRGRLISTSYDD